MTQRANVFQLDVPAGSGSAATTVFHTRLGTSAVKTILLTFPPGCAGNVGASIYAGGSPAYPNQDGIYLIYDDYTYQQDVANQINSGDWSIVAYNTDLVDHTLQVVYQWDPVAPNPTVTSSPLVSA